MLAGCSKFASGVPGSLNHLLPIYGVLSFSIGLLGTWSASNNAAMFAEIVPRSIRTSVYAFDRSCPSHSACTAHEAQPAQYTSLQGG